VRKKLKHQWQWPTIAIMLPAQTKPNNVGLASSMSDIVRLWQCLGYYNVTTTPRQQTLTKITRQHTIVWIVLLSCVCGVGIVFCFALLAIFVLAIRQ
jgi:hypothetical protein